MPPRRSARTTKADDAKTQDDDDKKVSDEEVDAKKSKTKDDKPAKSKGKKDDADDKADDKPAPRRSGRAKAADKKKDDESDDDKIDDEKDDPKTLKRKASGTPKGPAKDTKKKNKKDESDEDDDDDDKKSDDKVVKTVIAKGGVAVDEHFDVDDCEVYAANGKVYASTLNQSNLARNNNKFYIIQVLKHTKKPNTFYTWNRWGRVGVVGQVAREVFKDADAAVRAYEKKLKDKTVKGDYTIVDINYDDDDDDDKDKKKKKSPSPDKGKKSASPKKDDKKADDKKDDKKADDKEDAKMVKKIAKGGVAVDEFFPEKDCHVYIEAGKVYSATLNQSNLNHNNNKFYIIQVLESEKEKGVFYIWNRWGRVGVQGQSMKKKTTDIFEAKADYESKLRDKTVKGDYTIVDISYDDDKEEVKEEEPTDPKDEEKKCKLPSATKELIKLIFDLKMMNEQMKEIGYDAKKMPLGKLAKSSIQKGYTILKELAEAIKAKKGSSVLNDLSSQFYSNIPHDFGFSKMIEHVINSDEKVKKKLEMLQSIEDIQVATKLLDDKSKGKDESIIDVNYKKLNTELNPLDRSSDEFKLVEEYMKNTHASTHNQYSLEIIDAFEVKRQGEEERYKGSIHNKMLLWHGSRLTNFVGILSQGLRIAPPEAPVTGYMFGKGVYFADMVSKSANYCFTSTTNNTGILLLCEVACGNHNELYYADYNASNLPSGKHSTKGCGRTEPDPKGEKKLGDVRVPCGKGVNSNIPQGSLLYNEFIVYDVAQIKIRYLLKTRFDYKNRF